jgi:hypothetical protein
MTISTPDDDLEEDRRKFLKTCEIRFAAVTPPTITVLLSTSLATKAIADDGNNNGNNNKH